MIGNLKIFSLLKARMHWHQARQIVIAENIANADSPSYQARDLVEPDFKALLARERSNVSPTGSLKTTNKMHIQGMKTVNTAAMYKSNKSWETKPSGNNVVLEEQMMKLAENQMDYQTITALYGKSIKLMKMALGKS